MTIGIDRDGHVLTIELQRADRRNALDTQLCTELRTAIEGAAAGGARVIVLTGAGTSFCAGVDLSSDAIPTEFPTALGELNRAISAVEVPVIAAVNGPAVGAGVQIAMASDLRVVSPSAFFAIPATKLAIAVDNWTVKRLVSVAGGGVARTILMAAERVGAEQSFACGLANKIGDLKAAQEWAHTIAELSPLSLRHLKLVFNDDGSRGDTTDAQQSAYDAAWASSDIVEAREALREKRSPNFRGE